MPPKKKAKITATVRIQQEGGSANVSKLGQMLGGYGVNIGAVLKQFNEATAQLRGLTVPADIVIYDDRSVEVVPKSPAASSLIRRASGVAKGSSRPHVEKVGSITDTQLAEIATTKMPDLNANSLDEAKKIVAGTARSMGITIQG